MLFHDRATALGSVAGVIAIVFLVGQQLAIFFGLTGFMSSIADTSGADAWVLARNTENINAAGSIPLSWRDRVAGVDGVAWVEPVVITAGQLRRRDGNTIGVQVVGCNPPRLAGGPNRFAQGSIADLLDPEAVTVDKLELPELGYPGVGDALEINGKRVRVAAVTTGLRGFGGTLLYCSIAKAREIAGSGGDRCTALLIGLSPGRDAVGMVALLRGILPRAEVFATADLSRSTKLYYLKNSGIGTSFGFTTLIAALVGLVIIALTMYTNVISKSQDYAMLRVLGARRRDVLYIVFLQSLYIAAIGILLGFLLLAGFLSGTRESALPVSLPWLVGPALAAATLLLCLLGSLLAMRRAVKIEPASAFR
jgi:putative ABC transport system permease protein